MTDRAPKPIILTQEGYDHLQADLADMQRRQTDHQQEFADVNFSSDPTEEEAALYEARVSKEDFDQQVGHLLYVLENAEIVGADPDPTRVDPGERVTVWDFSARQEATFDLIDGEEIERGRDGVSLDSPVGKALLGRKIGDVIEVQIPDGIARYAIRQIEHL